ncbi:MAG: ClC family H(+)/Cl(-) exchange transporter [Leuconostoc citreum]
MFKRGFNFNTTRISFVGRGLLIGVLSGVVISVFRYAIEKLLLFWIEIYQCVALPKHGWFVIIIVLVNICIGLLIAKMVQQEPNISGSGIPQVEGQLMDELNTKWWAILWRKFVTGILGIGSGLMLGREGPSIQLGAAVGQGVGYTLHLDKNDKKIAIASGAAAGLSAAFNAPIAGVMFVLEEIYHSFSPLVWLSALSGAIAANGVSSSLFGLKPVLSVTQVPVLPLSSYGLLVILGLILGCFGYFYQRILLKTNIWYQKIFPVPHAYFGIVPLLMIIPVGLLWPKGLGGGNDIILSLGHVIPSLQILCVMIVVRFIFSMVSYGSGLPGGIFLPILTLGALIGAVTGQLFVLLGWLESQYVIDFMVVGMAGYFAGIGKAPFTAILLIVEMVGSLTHLMPLAIVSLLSYLTVDLLGGEPIYTSLLKRLIGPGSFIKSQETITIDIPVLVGSVLADQSVRDVPWPKNSLLVLVLRENSSIIPHGDLILRPGDQLRIQIEKKQSQAVRTQFLTLH